VTTPDRAGFGPLAAGIAAVSLGVARAAIDSFIATAKVKPLAGGNKPIASRELVQVEVATAEARLGAARAYLLEQAGNGVAIGERARLRLAATNAVEAAIEVCSAMFRAAGGGAVYTRSPLQRYLRDAQVVAQHIMVGSLVTTTIGRILLDIESDTSTL
jgi:alkylation response protein AidB-like acyl-CoA dehydrogenase